MAIVVNEMWTVSIF